MTAATAAEALLEAAAEPAGAEAVPIEAAVESAMAEAEGDDSKQLRHRLMRKMESKKSTYMTV